MPQHGKDGPCYFGGWGGAPLGLAPATPARGHVDFGNVSPAGAAAVPARWRDGERVPVLELVRCVGPRAPVRLVFCLLGASERSLGGRCHCLRFLCEVTEWAADWHKGTQLELLGTWGVWVKPGSQPAPSDDRVHSPSCWERSCPCASRSLTSSREGGFSGAVGTRRRMEAQLVTWGDGMGRTRRTCHFKMLIKNFFA